MIIPCEVVCNYNDIYLLYIIDLDKKISFLKKKLNIHPP